jgi:branched-chain amino acid transport system ATP-binding protein
MIIEVIDGHILNKGEVVYHDHPNELRNNMDIAYHHLAIS